MKKVALIAVMVIFGVGIGFAMGERPAKSGGGSAAITEQKQGNTLVIEDGQITDLKITTLKGERLTEESIKGKILIIDFWATWCPPCVASVPVFNSVHKDYPDDVIVVAVSVDQKPELVPPFVRKKRVKYRVAYSNRMLNNAVGGIQGIPTAVIFDRQGRLIEKAVGFHERRFFDALVDKH